MKTLVASSLALGLLTPTAWAATPAPSNSQAPVMLTEPQMATVKAGHGATVINETRGEVTTPKGRTNAHDNRTFHEG
jgi:hypothetical protein